MPDLSAAELPAAARGATENCDSIKRDSKFVERVREACRSGEEQLLDRLIQVFLAVCSTHYYYYLQETQAHKYTHRYTRTQMISSILKIK